MCLICVSVLYVYTCMSLVALCTEEGGNTITRCGCGIHIHTCACTFMPSLYYHRLCATDIFYLGCTDAESC